MEKLAGAGVEIVHVREPKGDSLVLHNRPSLMVCHTQSSAEERQKRAVSYWNRHAQAETSRHGHSERPWSKVFTQGEIRDD